MARSKTIKETATEWLAYHSPNVKESTAARYGWLIRCTIVPLVGSEPVASFDHLALQNFANRLPAFQPGLRGRRRADFQHYSLCTVRSALQVLKAVLRYAALAGYCRPLASYHVNMPRTADYYEQGRLKTLPAAQARRLMAEIREVILKPEEGSDTRKAAIRRERRYALGVTLALRAGLRIGEVAGLNYEDFDPTGPTIEVKRCVESHFTNGHTVVKVQPPKTLASRRVIPIDNDVADLLKRYMPKSGYLIPGAAGKALPSVRALSNWFCEWRRHHHYTKITFHGLRHTYATMLVAAGADAKLVSQLLGHSDVAITMRLYVHPDEESKRAAIERLKWE